MRVTTKPSARRKVVLYLEPTFLISPYTGTTGATLGATQAPGRAFIVEPGGGVEANKNIVSDEEHDGYAGTLRQTDTGNAYAGSFSFKADPENLWDKVLSITGKRVQTTAQAVDTTHDTAVYKHAFSEAFNFPSFTAEEIMDGNNAFLSAGVVCTDLQLEFGAILRGTWQAAAHAQIPNQYPNASGVLTNYRFDATARSLPPRMGGDTGVTIARTANPSFVDVAQGNSGNGPLVWKSRTFGSRQTTSYVAINGTEVQASILPGMQLNIRRDIESYQSGDSGADMDAPAGGNVVVTGSNLQFLYTDNELLLENMEFSRFALNIKFVGPAIGTSGLNQALELYLPHIKLKNVKRNTSGKGIMIVADFEAQVDPVTGSQMVLELWNTLDAAGFGGKAGISTTLSASPTAGATSISVTSASNLKVFDSILIGAAGSQEVRRITAISGTTLTLDVATTYAHTSGDAVVSNPLGGGGWLAA